MSMPGEPLIKPHPEVSNDPLMGQGLAMKASDKRPLHSNVPPPKAYANTLLRAKSDAAALRPPIHHPKAASELKAYKSRSDPHRYPKGKIICETL
jgi:hypothetical protein